MQLMISKRHSRRFIEKHSWIHSGVSATFQQEGTWVSTMGKSFSIEPLFNKNLPLYVSILLWNFVIIWNYPVCLSVLKIAYAEYATNAFSSNKKYEKLAVVVHVL